MGAEEMLAWGRLVCLRIGRMRLGGRWGRLWRSCGLLLDEVGWCGVRGASWVGGGVGVKARFRSEVGADGVLVDVGGASGVIVRVSDAAAVVTAFPYVEFAF